MDSGHIELSNLYEENSDEFITSSDGNFRPVNTYTGPDGCLYIVDMYRGVIQEKSFMTPYLKQEILRLNFDKNFRSLFAQKGLHQAPHKNKNQGRGIILF